MPSVVDRNVVMQGISVKRISVGTVRLITVLRIYIAGFNNQNTVTCLQRAYKYFVPL